MSVDISQFYQVFFEESLEGLDNMESALMALDTDNIDAETINTIFRAAHSIKGGSATFGFSEVASFTHVLETLLDEVREGSRGLAPDHVDLLLRSVDAMRNMIETLQAGETIDTSGSDELKVQFEAILSGGEAPAESAAESATDESKEASNAGWKIEFAPHPDMLRTGNEPIRMFRELGELGDLSVDCHTHKLPTFDALSPEECHLSWTLTLLGDVSIDDVKEVFEWVEDEADISYHPLAQSEGPVADYIENAVAEGGADQVVAAAEGANQAMISDMLDASGDSKPAVVTALADRSAGKAETQVEPAKPAAKAPVKPAAKPAAESSIRVGTDKIDQLINLVGELVITQSMLGQLGEGDSEDFTQEKLLRLQEGLSQLEQNTRELQESVMRIRMLPISFSFSRFPRMVRDLSQRLNKKINLVLQGEQTELDKTVMEKIGDPLVHLVRNSVDHGIESPDVREKAGKNRMGTIVLAAEQEGDHILLSITDDGGGMDPDKLRAIAVEKGLYDEEAVARLTDTEAYNLIFMPGFSTKKEISDVSGRGVGMDVVKTKITQLNGSLEINSELGVGTRINIKVPLTLAIMPTLMIMLGQQTFALPLVSVNEIFHMDLRKTNFVDGREVINIRNNSVPLFFLKRWLLKRGLLSEESANDDPYVHVVIVTVGTQRVGFVVDQLIGQEEVVIKPLGKMLQGTPGMSGATITGDGRIALILDVPGLLKRYA